MFIYRVLATVLLIVGNVSAQTTPDRSYPLRARSFEPNAPYACTAEWYRSCKKTETFSIPTYFTSYTCPFPQSCPELVKVPTKLCRFTVKEHSLAGNASWSATGNDHSIIMLLEAKGSGIPAERAWATVKVAEVLMIASDATQAELKAARCSYQNEARPGNCYCKDTYSGTKLPAGETCSAEDCVKLCQNMNSPHHPVTKIYDGFTPGTGAPNQCFMVP